MQTNYGIQEIVIDDKGDEVSRSLGTTVYNDLAQLRSHLEWLIDKTAKDDCPLTVGWQVVFRVVELAIVSGETRQANYGSK